MGHPKLFVNKWVSVVIVLIIGSCSGFAQQQPALPHNKNLFDPQVSLTVNPRTRNIQIYWSNDNVKRGDRILITDVDPSVDQFERLEEPLTVTMAPRIDLSTTTESDPITNIYSLDKFLGLAPDSTEESTEQTLPPEVQKIQWKFGDGSRDVLYSMMIQEPTGWWRTNVPFDVDSLKQLTKDTKCFGYWVHMINGTGTVITKNCMRAHPRWMNEMKDAIQDVKLRNLFIPGTHNSASFKSTFTENRLTKYAICQDDDIRSQLMQGIRYLDLRIGHYRKSNPAFFIVHSVVRFQPLIEVLDAVKSFVEETNEIVIIDFQEFPVGFQQDETGTHRKLVQFVYDQMKDHLIEPDGTWDVTLHDLWNKRGNVIIGYDKPGIQFEFREILWQSVEHLWPNRADVAGLVDYLKTTRNVTSQSYRMRPSAEMAELTPKAIDIITDRYGGLRKMAQTTNKVISELYSSQFGIEANVVAVDFHMSSTIIETALKFNALHLKKEESHVASRAGF